MDPITKAISEEATNQGFRLSTSKILMAPEFGGNFKSEGVSLRRGTTSAELGKYSTQTGENFYGYGGSTPFQVGDVKVGGAVGAYTNGTFSTGDIVLGFLASLPIKNGEIKALLAPGILSSTPNFFLSYSKNF